MTVKVGRLLLTQHRDGREPSRNLRSVSALTGDHRISRFAPIFTHRTHYGAPKARGHRQWIGEKR